MTVKVMVKDQHNQLGDKNLVLQVKVITFGVNPLRHRLFLDHETVFYF